MSKLRVMELFSGYGSQRMALRNLGIDFESVGISEIDIPAILSYASIHDGLDVEDETFEYPTKEEMIKFLESKNIGLDFKSGKVKLPKNLDKLKQIYRATVLSKCFGDVSLLKLSELPDVDFVTYSFPCTDISVAGQQKGIKKGQTRSGLLYECEKIIEEKRPKYLLMENVKNLVGKKFKEQFDEWLSYLESLGYKNYWQVLNAKDYKVPQNRERVFVVSILGEHDGYTFPQKQRLDIRLKDVLEPQVEDKYYLSEEVQARFKPNKNFKDKLSENDVCESGFVAYGTGTNKKHQSNTVYDFNHINPTLNATDYKNPTKIIEYDVDKLDKDGYTICETRCDEGIRFFKDNICGTLRTIDAGGDKRVIEHDIDYMIASTQKNTFVGDGSDGLNHTLTTCDYKDPANIVELNQVGSLEGKHEQSSRVYSEDGLSPTIMAGERKSCTGGYVSPKFLQSSTYRIRKLTPLEYWRLMGCSDEDFYKAKQFNSDSQLYKQAGNSIVVNVLEGIFANMFSIDNYDEKDNYDGDRL